MFDTVAFVGFCLAIVAVAFLAIKLDDGAESRRGGPWKPPAPKRNRTEDDDDEPVAPRPARRKTDFRRR